MKKKAGGITGNNPESSLQQDNGQLIFENLIDIISQKKMRTIKMNLKKL